MTEKEKIIYEELLNELQSSKDIHVDEKGLWWLSKGSVQEIVDSKRELKKELQQAKDEITAMEKRFDWLLSRSKEDIKKLMAEIAFLKEKREK